MKKIIHALLLGGAFAATAFAAAKPNILFVLIDDMGWKDLKFTKDLAEKERELFKARLQGRQPARP